LAAAVVWVSLALPLQARPKSASIVVDGYTGRAVYSYRADELRYPASLTKMMTLYVLFEEMAAKRLTLKTRFSVSAHAASRPPSRLGLKPGETISVRNAILALVTKSANDVAATIAENLAGSEPRFARRMTKTARRIGMKRTVFRNASGLPDTRQVTTARDMARLAISLQKRFPTYYRYFKTRKFRFRGRTYSNHNRLLGRYAGTDGIKTGYTRASGYNLTSSVRRNGKHLIGVVFGGRSSRDRNRTMRLLLDRSFPKVVAHKAQKPVVMAAVARSRKIQARIPASPAKPRVMVAASTMPRPLAPPRPAAAPVARQAAAPAPQKPSILIMPAATGTPTVKPAVMPAPATAAPVTAAPVTAERSEDSWSIQIGAYATEQAAHDRLALARAKPVSVLSGKRQLAVAAKVSGRSFFRARFAGFASRDTAQRACRRLQRHAIRCYAIAPNS